MGTAAVYGGFIYPVICVLLSYQKAYFTTAHREPTVSNITSINPTAIPTSSNSKIYSNERCEISRIQSEQLRTQQEGRWSQFRPVTISGAEQIVQNGKKISQHKIRITSLNREISSTDIFIQDSEFINTTQQSTAHEQEISSEHTITQENGMTSSQHSITVTSTDISFLAENFETSTVSNLEQLALREQAVSTDHAATEYASTLEQPTQPEKDVSIGQTGTEDALISEQPTQPEQDQTTEHAASTSEQPTPQAQETSSQQPALQEQGTSPHFNVPMLTEDPTRATDSDIITQVVLTSEQPTPYEHEILSEHLVSTQEDPVSTDDPTRQITKDDSTSESTQKQQQETSTPQEEQNTSPHHEEPVSTDDPSRENMQEDSTSVSTPQEQETSTQQSLTQGQDTTPYQEDSLPTERLTRAADPDSATLEPEAPQQTYASTPSNTITPQVESSTPTNDPEPNPSQPHSDPHVPPYPDLSPSVPDLAPYQGPGPPAISRLCVIVVALISLAFPVSVSVSLTPDLSPARWNVLDLYPKSAYALALL